MIDRKHDAKALKAAYIEGFEHGLQRAFDIVSLERDEHMKKAEEFYAQSDTHLFVEDFGE